MNQVDLAHLRLHNQQIANATHDTPGDVVRWLGALQAQDYLGALCAIGVRMQGATEAAIEQAIANKTIVRTWPMRGTLHIVAAADVRWMLALLTPRSIARSAGRARQLELNAAVFARSADIISAALEGGKQLDRATLFQHLEAAHIPTTGQRGIHILGRLAQEGVLCLGARAGKQHTFTLLDEWVPPAPTLDREAALAELARRYFTGHGPATIHDYLWWSGLSARDGRAGLALVAAQLVQVTVDDQQYWLASDALPLHNPVPEAYLLPSFDEYLLGYTDRSAVLAPEHRERVQPSSNGMFSPLMVYGGRVVGTWKRSLKKDAVVVTLQPFSTGTFAPTDAFAAAAQRYGAFLELPVRWA